MAVTITVNGKPVRLVSLDEMDFDELDLLNELTGMGAQSAADAIADLHPKAWRAVLLISVRRVEPEASVADLKDVHLFEVLDEINAQTAKASDADPPALTRPEQPERQPEAAPPDSNESTGGSEKPTVTLVASGGQG